MSALRGEMGKNETGKEMPMCSASLAERLGDENVERGRHRPEKLVVIPQILRMRCCAGPYTRCRATRMLRPGP